MRFATLELPGQDDPLELSVTSLDAGTQIDDYYLLQNINRWRRQLTLPRINIDQLPDVIERFDVAGGAAILVTGLVGTFEKSGPMTAPFAPPSGAARPRFAPPQLSYDTPAGWKPGQLVVERGGITVRRQAAFVSGDGADRAEITVTAMPAAGPGMLMNVNRWRKQVGLTPVSTAELDQVFSPFEIGTHAGRFVAFEGRDQTIYGVIAEIERLNWFFKLVGSRSAAARERERFESFVRSAQLGAAGSDNDGRQ